MRTAHANRNGVAVTGNTAIMNIRLGGKICCKCHLKNHFQSCCKTKLICTVDNRTKKSDAHSESEEEIFVHSNDAETCDEWFAPLSVNGTILPLKIDTGAQSNLLSMKDYNVLKQRPKLKERDRNLTSYNNDIILTIGTRVKYNKIAYDIAFVVVTSDDKTLLLKSRPSEPMSLVMKSRHVQVHTLTKGACTDTKSRT